MQSTLCQFVFKSTLSLNYAVNKLIQMGCPKSSLVPVRLILHITEEAQAFSKKVILECILASGGIEVDEGIISNALDQESKQDIKPEELEKQIKNKEELTKKNSDLISKNLDFFLVFKFPSSLEARAASDRLSLLGAGLNDINSAIEGLLFLNKAAFSVNWTTALLIVEFHRGFQIRHGSTFSQCLAAEKDEIKLNFNREEDAKVIREELIKNGLSEDDIRQEEFTIIVSKKLWKKINKIKAKVKYANGELQTKAGRVKV